MEARWPSERHGPVLQRQVITDGSSQALRDYGSSGVVAQIGQPTEAPGNATIRRAIAPFWRNCTILPDREWP